MHAVTYFAPEARTALNELGFRGFWMGYFAARSAPFGVVPTELVTAAFYNFAAERVAKALPAAWEIASPSDALRIRQDSAVAALRRYGVTDDDAGTAAELAEKAVRGAPLDGRKLRNVEAVARFVCGRVWSQRSERYGSSRCIAMIARRVEIFFSSSSCMIASRFAAKVPTKRTM